jgi:hypothetical protein
MHLTLFLFLHIQPYEINLSTLESSCKPLGVFVQVVPPGVNLIPPSKRVETLGHKNSAIRREQKKLDHMFAVLSTDENVEEDGVLAGDSGSSWE